MRVPRLAVVLIAGAFIACRAETPVLPEWRVEPTPELRIGTEGDSSDEFGFIIGLARLTDGSIAVADRGNLEVKLYGPDGTFRRTFGRKGSGPGEFDQPLWLGHSGDTLFVYDFSFQRITAIDARSGSIADSRAPQRDSDLPVSLLARLPNGALLGMAAPWISLDRPDGVRRDSARVVILPAAESGAAIVLGTFPGLSTYAVNPKGEARASSVGVDMFAPHLHAAPAGRNVAVGDAAAPVVLLYGEQGRLLAEYRLPIEPLALDVRTVDSLRAAALAAASSDRERESVEARFAARYLPSERPFFRGLLSGPGNELWVELFHEDSGRHEYLVLNADGHAVARVRAPAGVRVYEVGNDYLLGTRQDEAGADVVVLHTYRR